ncbi:MAG: sialate O-acetylesterase [Oscillospiraceae bacterium]
MKKIISLMLAVTMICASIGLTAFAATTTTVEAEADGVSAYTLPSSDKSNSKILKNTVSSKESVTYYIQANNTPRATMFKLAQVNTGDKINVDINFTYLDTATMELEYCLFVSDSEITLTSHSQDLVKEELEKHTDESNIKNWSTNKSNMKYSLPNGITASKDGFVYLYIGCGDLSEDKTQVTKKIQWSIDSFDVNIDSDGGGETEPDTTPTPTTTINPDVTPTPTPTASPTPTPTLEPELTLDAVYSSNMVLQRKEPITITGTGKSGNTVSVNFNGADEQTTIEHGLWEITLPAMEAVKSATMTVSSGDNMITLDNVAVGDVIFCTGQSNMFNRLETFPTLMNEELSEAYEDVRYMNSFDEISEWKVATMENSKQFSALGFLIGKRMIKKDSDVPIGLISSSLGGSSIMQWIPTYSVNWDSQAKRMMAGASSKGGLYTQRLLPLKNLKASAVVWYQGEANTTFESGTVYEQALTSLINNWRKTFNDEDLPFVVIQLPTANFAKIYSTIRIGTGVRAGQWNVSQRMDNVKTVVSNDTGTTNNVHPNDKGPIADRAVAYIEDFINNTQSNVESPSFDYMERSGDKLILHFKNTYGSLSTDDGGVPLGFELKDDDGIYKDITPTINGDTIEIDVTDITNPQVKYAWSDTPGIAKDLVEAQTDTPAVINTFNAAGRPIAPFMTDLTEKYASKAVNKELSTTEFYNYAPYISKVEQSGDDIVISAYDTDGVVSKVEVYIDEGEIKAGDAKQRDDGKWVFTPDVTSGVHSVYAIATDNDNINSLTCVDYTTYNIIRPTRSDYVKGYTESPSSVEYNNGDDMLAKATNDVNGTTTTVTSAIPTGETTKSLKLSATGNKATANATIPISKADNPQKTLTIEYDTMFESADDAIGASRGMYAKTKEGNELWLTYFTASSLRTAITNTGGNWCYEQAMSIKNNQWHHIKLELHPNTGIFSIWLDGTMLQDNVSFVKEGSSFDTCKGAFDTLKEGITDLRFYHTASNNIENATYIDNVKVTEVSYSEEEIIPPAKIQEATPQISIDYINETLTGFESQEPYTIKVGEGNAKDITLGEGVTTISLDDEKIGYAGKLLSIEIVKKARNTETYTDSDVQQLTVKARPKAPTTVQGVNATEIGGKGKLTGMNGMQYKLKRTDEWSSTQLVDTVEVDAGEYNVRKAATDTDFASEKTTITVETFIAEKEMTPEIAIDYTTEELINFVEDGTYTINGLDVTLTDNKLSLANYITNEQITLSIVKKGNNVTTVASEAQTLIVKARPAAPTKSEIIVTQPSVIGGKGTIAGIADTMEYSTNNGINWTTGDGDDIGDIEPGTTYKIRYKAVSADEEAERQFKSAEYSVTIIAYDAMPETQPTISINYVNEKLTGFTEGCDYIIKIDDGVATDKDNVTEDIDIDNTYFGHTLKIVKKGDGIKTSNSEAFELSIPKRSSAPNVAAVEEQTYQGNDGKITGVDTTMEYKSLSEPTFTWTQCAGTEITNLAPGSYIVRVAAVADESFASEVMSVTINAAAKDEPTEPTVNITYDDKNGNVNAIFTNITEEGMVYVAEYNENGTLLSIKSDEISDSVIIPFTCVNKSKVKVFIWKNDMKPLFNKVFTLN